jgi:hypothetical protein
VIPVERDRDFRFERDRGFRRIVTGVNAGSALGWVLHRSVTIGQIWFSL